MTDTFILDVYRLPLKAFLSVSIAQLTLLAITFLPQIYSKFCLLVMFVNLFHQIKFCHLFVKFFILIILTHLSKLVQTCSNLSKLVQTCTNLVKIGKTCKKFKRFGKLLRQFGKLEKTWKTEKHENTLRIFKKTWGSLRNFVNIPKLCKNRQNLKNLGETYKNWEA